MKLRLLIAFILAFVFGVLIAAGTLRPPKIVTANPPAGVTTAADAGVADDSTDQHPVAWPASVGSPEQVMYAQAQRLNDALAKLAPRTEGKTNLYLILFAGDGEENVFRNEAEYVQTLFTKRFAAAGHVLTLINNPATLDRYPIASLSNLEIAIDALGRKMNPQQDVLLVFITTHGSREHELYVSLDPLPLDQIEPEDLADLFSDSPIRNRVFVISACYAGGFIDALKNDDTMIITAARTDRASFGCGTQSRITDFGRAFFVEALNHSASFPQAFAEARKLIDAWETRDGEEHSYPQIWTTPKIEARLKAWSDGIKLGAPVPFGSPPQNHHRPATDGHNPQAVAYARR
ncbi:MAG: C13 family peptidase [Rudaea sp.]